MFSISTENKAIKLNEIKIESNLELFFKHIMQKEKATSYQKEIINVLKDSSINFRQDILAEFGKSDDRRLSYVIPMMYYINGMSNALQAMIIVNDNQDAVDVFNLVKKYSRIIDTEVILLNSFSSVKEQSIKLSKKSQIVVSTVSRLNEHLSTGSISLDELRVFIIDKMEDHSRSKNDMLALCQCTKAVKESSSKWIFCNYGSKNQIKDFNKEFMSNPINVSVNNEVVFNNLKYFYLPVSLNHKLSSLVSILDSISEDSKICIITKKDSESNELSVFLNCMGFSSINLSEKKDGEVDTNKKIFIVTNENYAALENIAIKTVISLNACANLKECARKNQIVKNTEEVTLIELVNKNDQDFIDSLKQYSSVTVARFVFAPNYESRDSKITRLKNYLTVLSKDISLNENSEKINEIVNSFSEVEKNYILKNIILNLSNAVIPSFEFDKSATESRSGAAKITMTLKAEGQDSLTNEMVTEYLENTLQIAKENILSVNLAEDKISLELKNVIKNEICNKIKENLLNGFILEIESIVVSEGSSKYERAPFKKSFERRSGGGDFRRGGFSSGRGRFGDRGGDSRGGENRGGDRFRNRSDDRSERRPYSNRSDRSEGGFNSSENSSGFGERRPYSSDRSGFSSDRGERSGFGGNRGGGFGERRSFEKKDDFFGKREGRDRGGFKGGSGGFKKKFDSNSTGGFFGKKSFSKGSDY